MQRADRWRTCGGGGDDGGGGGANGHDRLGVVELGDDGRLEEGIRRREDGERVLGGEGVVLDQ